MSKYSFYIDHRPALVNELFRKTLRARINLEERDAAAVLAAVTEAGIPEAVRRRRLSVIVSTPGEPDADAIFKSLLDSLVACGMLTTDRLRGVELAEPCYLRGPKWCVITLEDLDDEPEFVTRPRPVPRRRVGPRRNPPARPPAQDEDRVRPQPRPVPDQSDLDFVRDPKNWRGRR